MITREQSDKILEQIIQRNNNEVFKPLRELVEVASKIIGSEVYCNTIARKNTWKHNHQNVKLGDYGFDVSFNGNASLCITICYYKSSFRCEQREDNIYAHTFDESSLSRIYDCLLNYIGNKASGYIKWAVNPENDIKLEQYRAGFNKELNGERVKEILNGIKSYFDFAKEFLTSLKDKIEELSREVTTAYNNALEQEAEDDAIVLKEFGLTPDSVEPESFEVKIEVVKVNRGKKSTKKGKK